MLTLLAESYRTTTRVVEALADDDFDRPTRAEAWTVKELLLHQAMDAIRALAAFATTVGAEPDVDAVTYWAPFRPGTAEEDGASPAAHARWVQRSAAAYDGPRGVVDLWRVVSTGAARAAAAADPAARVTTQGHVLTVPDLVSTLVVESTVHHLDLTLDLPDALPPPPAALAETRRVLEAIEGGPLPAEWDDTEAVLRGTGRLPGWRALLG